MGMYYVTAVSKVPSNLNALLEYLNALLEYIDFMLRSKS